MTSRTLRRQMLDGLVVVELSRSVRAAYLGKLLADAGARVIKVELPDAPPVSTGERAWLDAGKQSAILDWCGPAAGLLLRLVARADVLIEDQEPGQLERAGVAPDALRTDNPRLVHTSVTDFGSDGPWAARPSTDLIVNALSGMASLNNMSGRVPLRQPGEQATMLGAMFGYLGTLTALVNRDVTGLGQRVDVSSLEAVASVLTPQFLHLAYKHGPYQQRLPGAEALIRCADGWVSLTPYPDRAWSALTALFGLDYSPDDPRFITEAARRTNRDAVNALLDPIFATRTRRELFEDLSSVRVVTGMVLYPHEMPADPHLAERGAFLDQPIAVAATEHITLPAPPFRIAGERPAPAPPPPEPGADIDAVLSMIGLIAAHDRRQQEVVR